MPANPRYIGKAKRPSEGTRVQDAQLLFGKILNAKERGQPTAYHFKILHNATSVGDMVEGVNVVYIGPIIKDGKLSGYSCKIIDAECNETILFDVSEKIYKRVKLIVDAEPKEPRKNPTQGEKEQDAKKLFTCILKKKNERQSTTYYFNELKDAQSVEQTKKGHDVVYIGRIGEEETSEYLCKIFDEQGYSKASIRIKKDIYSKIVSVDETIFKRHALVAEFKQKLSAIQEMIYNGKESKKEGESFNNFFSDPVRFSSQLVFGTSSVAVEVPVDENKVIEDFLVEIAAKIETANTLAKSELSKIKVEAKVLIYILPLQKEFWSISKKIRQVLEASQDVEDSWIKERIDPYLIGIGLQVAEYEAILKKQQLTQEKHNEIQKIIEQLKKIQIAAQELLNCILKMRENNTKLADYSFESMSDRVNVLRPNVIYISKEGKCKFLGKQGQPVEQLSLSAVQSIQQESFSIQLSNLELQRAILNEFAELGLVSYSVAEDWRLTLSKLCEALNRAKNFTQRNEPNIVPFQQELQRIGILYEDGEYRPGLQKADSRVKYRDYICNESSLIDVALAPHKWEERRGNLADLHAKQFEFDDSTLTALSNIPTDVQVAIKEIKTFRQDSLRGLFTRVTDEDQKKAEAALSEPERTSLKQTNTLIQKYEGDRAKLQFLEAGFLKEMIQVKILDEKIQQLREVDAVVEKIDEDKKSLSEELERKEKFLEIQGKILANITANLEKCRTDFENLNYEDDLLQSRNKQQIGCAKEQIENSIFEFIKSNPRFERVSSSFFANIFGLSVKQQLAEELDEIRNDIRIDPGMALAEIYRRFNSAMKRFNEDKTGFFSGVTEEESKAVEAFCNRFRKENNSFFQLEIDLPHFNGDIVERNRNLRNQKEELVIQLQAQEKRVLDIKKKIKDRKDKVTVLFELYEKEVNKKNDLEEQIKDIESKCITVVTQRNIVKTTESALIERRKKLEEKKYSSEAVVSCNRIELETALRNVHADYESPPVSRRKPNEVAVSCDRVELKIALSNTHDDYTPSASHRISNSTGQSIKANNNVSSSPTSAPTPNLEHRSLNITEPGFAINASKESNSITNLGAVMRQRRAVSMILSSSEHNTLEKIPHSSSMSSQESLASMAGAAAGSQSSISEPSSPLAVSPEQQSRIDLAEPPIRASQCRDSLFSYSDNDVKETKEELSAIGRIGLRLS